MRKGFFSTSEAAKILGISRIGVFKRIQRGKIKARKIGRNYVISKKELARDTLTQDTKHSIEQAVKKTVREYGETLRLLGQE